MALARPSLCRQQVWFLPVPAETSPHPASSPCPAFGGHWVLTLAWVGPQELICSESTPQAPGAPAAAGGLEMPISSLKTISSL